jgi:hypothetical protein
MGPGMGPGGPGGPGAAGKNCAIKFNGECRSPAWMAKREKCAAQVQAAFMPGTGIGGDAHSRDTYGRMALRKCMQGLPW